MRLSGIQTFIIDLPKRRAHNWASKMSTPIGSHLVVKLSDDEGHVGWGIFMLAWGLLVVSSVDNFLKPILISRSARAQTSSRAIERRQKTRTASASIPKTPKSAACPWLLVSAVPTSKYDTIGRLMRNPKTPAPTKFQKPTAIRK